MLNRLKSADTASSSCPNASAADSYVYDADGNITLKSLGGTTTAYTYNAANQPTNSGDSYDANGNMLTDSGVFTASIYDPLDQLVDRSGDSRLSSIGFFVLYGLVIGLLAAAVGAAVGRLSYRSSRKEGS